MQNDIKNALDVLRKGGVILCPTDTAWSLACDATNPDAVARLLLISTHTSASVTLLLDTENRIASYFDGIPDVVYDLIEFSEKPLIVIIEGAKGLAKNALNASDNSGGISIVKSQFCKHLLQQFRKPLATVPAGLSNQTPKVFNEINAEIINQVDYSVNQIENQHINSRKPSIIRIKKDLSIKILQE